MPTFHTTITAGLEEAGDIRRQCLTALQEWTVQGSRVTVDSINGWTCKTVTSKSSENTTLSGRLCVNEELLGTVYVQFKVSILTFPNDPESMNSIAIYYRTFHSNPNYRHAHELQVPYIVLGIYRPWKDIKEAFAWSMSDYIELIVDPDEVYNLANIAESLF